MTEEDNTTDRHYEDLRKAVKEANKEIIPEVKGSPNHPVMTDIVMELGDERQKYKWKDRQQYHVLNHTIHKECLAAKKRCMEERCTK